MLSESPVPRGARSPGCGPSKKVGILRRVPRLQQAEAAGGEDLPISPGVVGEGLQPHPEVGLQGRGDKGG